jgi:hypothetical protein
MLIKDKNLEEVYEIISEDNESAAFLVNLRNIIRILGIINMP